MVNINFIKYSKLYYLFSGILVALSIVFLIFFGLKFGIEFRGGSILEIQFIGDRPSSQQVGEKLSDLNLGEVIVQPSGEKGMILRLKEVDEPTHQAVVSRLQETSDLEEIRFELVGPAVGKEIARKTELALFLTLFAITLYIAFAFRKVSRPVSSRYYGIASLVALFHDVLIPVGLFSLLGRFYNVEITIPVVAALLTVLGFSVHDTIVIFDRIRENLFRAGSKTFEETVNWSLNQTLGRSINTVLTTLFVVLALYFFGGDTLRYFALALIAGMISGAYSSIFIAGPLLVSWNKFRAKRGA